MNDEALVSGLRMLRGEWAEQGYGELQVRQSTFDEILREDFDADIVIFASRHLGELCERNLLRPVRAGTLQSETLDLEDLFPLIREREIVYGGQIMALPLGCPTPLRVLFEESGAAGEGRSAAASLAIPLEGHAAGLVLLAYAAPLAYHPSREGILFDVETMASRLGEPPFIRALERLAGEVRQESPVDNCGVAHLLTSGTASEAILWPCRSAADSSAAATIPGRESRVFEVFQTDEVYNPISRQWEPVEGRARGVPLLATSGRLAGVTTTSRNATYAFKLLEWLASPDIVAQLTRKSNALATCRRRIARQPDSWLGTEAAGLDFNRKLAEVLGGDRGVCVPRLPGVDRYLDALSHAVRRAILQRESPPEVMAQVAREWDAITDQLGRDRQREAYRRSLAPLGTAR